MKPVCMLIMVLGAAAAAGCAAGRSADELKSEVEVVGCLTGANGEFVLTQLDRANTGTTIAAPSTESYRLIGDANALRPHVGSQVRVAGMAEAPDVAVVRESSPAAAAGQPGVGTAGNAAPQPAPGTAAEAPAAGTPKVMTEQQTRLEVSSLQVRSIAATGKSCTP